jgi:acyl-CoA dehydrogenase
LIGKDEERGITVALIPTNTPGIEIGRRHFPLNIPFQNGPNTGKDVFIPMDMIIGGVEQVGQGWKMLMESLAAGRSISLPSLSAGAGKLACRATGGYARIRKQFKTPIGFFEGVEERLARIAAYTYRMDAVREMTCGAVDLGEKPSVVSAIAKYNLTEAMRTVVNDAVDIQGGAAICLGPRNFIGRIYQAIPISITVEGANILTRSLIIFGQGAIRCHPYVADEMHAVSDDNAIRGLENFDKALFGHIGFTFSNIARTLFLGLTGARLVKKPVSSPDYRYYQQLTRFSSAFALLADMSMLVLGGTLKRKEKLSGRLADVLSHLYLASACLKRFNDQGCPTDDLPLLRWACEDSLYTIQQSITGLLRNFPILPFAWILRILIFPYGKTFKQPSDALGQNVARMLLKPSPARDRLTDGIYCPEDTNEPLGRIDDALKKVILAAPVEKELNKAIREGVIQPRSSAKTLEEQLEDAVSVNIITHEQANLVREAIAARRDVITVDDFDPDFGKNTD